MEHKYIYTILRTREIMSYYRYVDDILKIYDQHKTNIKQTLEEFNNIHPTIEKEQQEKVNYLDITIHRKNKRLEFSIYRKPTQT
jgi:regulator of sigma D